MNNYHCKVCGLWLFKTELTSGSVMVRCRRCRITFEVKLRSEQASHLEAAGMR